MACNVLPSLRIALREDICIISCHFQSRTHTVVCSWVDAGRVNHLLMMLSWPTTTGLSRLVSIGVLSALTTIKCSKRCTASQLRARRRTSIATANCIIWTCDSIWNSFFHPTRLTKSHTNTWIKPLKMGDLYVLALWGNSPCGNNTTLAGFISQNETSTRQMMSSFSL